MEATRIRKQYRVQLEGELIDDISRAAEMLGFTSGNQIAASVIRQFFPIWLQKELLKQSEIRAQVENSVAA